MAKQITFDNYEVNSLIRILEHEKERVSADFNKNKLTPALYKMKLEELEVLWSRLSGINFKPNYERVSKNFEYKSKRRQVGSEGE